MLIFDHSSFPKTITPRVWIVEGGWSFFWFGFGITYVPFLNTYETLTLVNRKIPSAKGEGAKQIK